MGGRFLKNVLIFGKKGGADAQTAPQNTRGVRLPLPAVKYLGTAYTIDPLPLLSVRVSTPGRHPKTFGFNVAEGRI